ncbi:MAG: hypothetical protein HFH02_13145 [Dorea sp.]|nr:hypothetical protein [Dorea sp.]
MSITTIKEDYRSFGFVRYFQSDRCINHGTLRKFNQGKIKANELVTFDCGLMELKEIEKSEINLPLKGEQLLAIIVRPEIEPNYRLEQGQRFEFCGYDLVDISTCISAITNCGAEFDSIDYEALNQYGLIPSYREAVNTQLDLHKKYPEESHTYCEIVEIWRWLING